MPWMNHKQIFYLAMNPGDLPEDGISIRIRETRGTPSTCLTCSEGVISTYVSTVESTTLREPSSGVELPFEYLAEEKHQERADVTYRRFGIATVSQYYHQNVSLQTNMSLGLLPDLRSEESEESCYHKEVRDSEEINDRLTNNSPKHGSWRVDAYNRSHHKRIALIRE
ncbi:hypothetical protein T265_02789 [Opisthorchis viverrini]|uniref:Uncharacterized protein n=1 Tax=Opisthorchis viverrini TaxID=6198 RepID=A0A074ZTQ6_OPIVI|nr:hypothetical protein T265_02789 [Opisthorchis viverrini]KER30858.1 hypothetical protein T265_02789 [Opisthorchis viverrini]